MKKQLFIKRIIAMLLPIKSSLIYFIILRYIFNITARRGTVYNIFLVVIYNLMTQYIFVLYSRIIATSSSNTNIEKKIPRIPTTLHTFSISNTLEGVNPFVRDEIIFAEKHTVKFCSICNLYRPPRSQHCYKCNRCFNKQHVHDYLFNRCIFFDNYKFYLLYKLISMIRNIYVCCLLSLAKGNEYIVLLIAFCVSILEIIVDLYSFYANFFYLLNNETVKECIAIDNYIKGISNTKYYFQEGPIVDCVEVQDRPGFRKLLNPYNINIRENICQVFGHNPLKAISIEFTGVGSSIVYPKKD